MTLNLDSETRRESARQADGRFGCQEHAEAEGGMSVLDDHAPQAVTVEDATGDWVAVFPGVIDEDAEWLYTHGQCLALAVAASKRTGWPVVLHTFQDATGEWDDETDSPVTVENMKHAYLQCPDGALLDITGIEWGDEEVFREFVEEDSMGEDGMRIVPAHDAPALLEEFAGYLAPQNLEVADSFVGPMLALADDQDGFSDDERVTQPDDRPFWRLENQADRLISPTRVRSTQGA